MTIEQRAAALFYDHQQRIHRRTDRAFSILMLVQWIAALASALWLSPKTWSGPYSQTHIHVWLALYLGGIITLYPVFLAWTQPGKILTRHVIAVGQLLMSALLIHLTGGRIETHFHVFGSLAFLAFYRDWRVLITATVVTAADHLGRGLFLPQSVFGVNSPESWRWLEHAGWVLFEDVFLIISCQWSLCDLHRICEQEAQLDAKLDASNAELERRNEELLANNAVLENAVEGISRLDAAGYYIAVNTAYATTFGYTPEEMIGMNWEATVLPLDHAQMRDAFQTMLLKGKAETEVQGVKKDDTLFYQQVTLIAAYDKAGNYVGTHRFVKDVTERRALEDKISHQAFHDALSGLPNRILFTDRVEQALARTERHTDSTAVIFLDLDNFKVINDSLGHDEGDRLLVIVAERLQECVRPGDTVARLGGDEFTILLEDMIGEKDAIAVAERIIARLHEPIRLATREVFITCSIGIALSNRGCEGTEGLLRDADTAMYQAKLSGKAGYVLFDRSMNERVVERMEIETALRRALENGEFFVLYQPIINLQTGEINGAEALVRWEHPKLGTVQPMKFIPIAEETGLIVPIGAWVLREACLRAKAWQDEYGDSRSFVMSVNLSGRQLQCADLVQTVVDILQETGLNPANLKLEITESAMMGDMEDSIRRMQELKALGIRLAVDDFGTGYSSLSYLQRLPVDTVKINRSFINIMGDDIQPAAIVQTIIMLCRALHMDVTGEGIENSGQLVQLQTLGCHHGQGYHFSKPITAEKFDALLKVGRITPPRDAEECPKEQAAYVKHAA